MKVSEVKQSNNFCGIPLIKTTLQKQVCKGLYRPIDAFVYLMQKADLDKVGMNTRAWKNTKYGISILFDAQSRLNNPFQNTTQRFLFVETPQEMDYCSIKALASYFEDTDQIRLSSLQSLRPHEILEPVKGAGIVILYTASKIAEKLKKAQICLVSRGKPETLAFYRQSGMIEKENNFFTLPSEKFESFQEKIKEKFPIVKIFEENIN